MRMAELPGHYCRPARGTDGIARVDIVKTNPLFREPIDLWCGVQIGQTSPIGPDRVRRVVVSVEEEDVWGIVGLISFDSLALRRRDSVRADALPLPERKGRCKQKRCCQEEKRRDQCASPMYVTKMRWDFEVLSDR